MAKKKGVGRKVPSSASKAYGSSSKKMKNTGYYEPFAGFENSNYDQNVYWDMVDVPKGVVPREFMEKTLPMANDVGKKNKSGY